MGFQVDEDEEKIVSTPLSPVQAANSSSSASQSTLQAGFLSSLYMSSTVSSITINPNEVYLGKVYFGPKESAEGVYSQAIPTHNGDYGLQGYCTELGDGGHQW